MTTAPTVCRALVNLIGRSPAFRTRQVSLAHPGALLELESVWIQRVNAKDTARLLGKGHRREELTVVLALVAEVNADDAGDALDRAYQMFSDLETVIGGNPSLGVENVIHAQITSWDQQSFTGDGRRAVEMTVDVTVIANKDLMED